MIWMLAIGSLVMWLSGLILSVRLGGFIHIFLVLGVLAVLSRLMKNDEKPMPEFLGFF